MHHRRVLVVLSAVAFFTLLQLSACGAESAMNAQVRSAAATDLNCHQSAIEFVEDKPLEKRVRGCGQELIYARTCAGGDPGAAGSCQWTARVPDNDDEVGAVPPVEASFDGETSVETEKVSE